MLYDYENCIEEYKNDYNLKKAMDNKAIFKVEKGVYSTSSFVNDFDYISFKRPDAIFTLYTACYIYDLTDTIPEVYDLAIDRNSSRTKLTKCKVKYYFLNKDILNIGKIKYKYLNSEITIYDKERLLIELFRYKTKLPLDFYKEVVNNYRKQDIDIEKIQEYMKKFKLRDKIFNSFQMEVL